MDETGESFPNDAFSCDSCGESVLSSEVYCQHCGAEPKTANLAKSGSSSFTAQMSSRFKWRMGVSWSIAIRMMRYTPEEIQMTFKRHCALCGKPLPGTILS